MWLDGCGVRSGAVPLSTSSSCRSQHQRDFVIAPSSHLHPTCNNISPTLRHGTETIPPIYNPPTRRVRPIEPISYPRNPYSLESPPNIPMGTPRYLSYLRHPRIDHLTSNKTPRCTITTCESRSLPAIPGADGSVRGTQESGG